jgi:hypothetical protein
MADKDAATLLAELIKEEVLSDLRETLDEVMSSEICRA